MMAGMPRALPIDPENPSEVAHWCDSLDCTERELLEAIRAVGGIVEDIASHLDRTISHSVLRPGSRMTVGSLKPPFPVDP
jgi:hypothetical protein